MALRSSASVQSNTRWLKLHGSWPHARVQHAWSMTLPLRRSSSDKSTSILFMTMLPCFRSCSKSLLPLHYSAFESWLWSSFLEFFPQKKFLFLFPWMWIHEARLWLFSSSTSHCLRPKIRYTMFQKICCAKSGEFPKSLTMFLLSVPCSGVQVYICSPQSDSCNIVAGIPQLLKFPNTSQDVIIPEVLA